MRRRKITGRVLLLLTLLQLVVFLFRDRFQYQPYTTREKLYAPCDGNCINTWRQFADDYPASELKKALVIADSVMDPRQQTASQIMILGKFLYRRFYRQLGRPDASLVTASPLEQYEQLSHDSTRQLWCGNFAQMFAFFCWSKGIACRIIEIMKDGDHHVLNECYLPDQQRWVMVDLTNNLLMVTGYPTTPLNLLQFTAALKDSPNLYACRTHDTDGIIAPLRGREALLNYYNPSYPLYYYHRTDNAKAYSTGNKLKQYFLPLSWYDILTPERKTNALFYLKEALVLVWLLALLAFLSGRPKFGL